MFFGVNNLMNSFNVTTGALSLFSLATFLGANPAQALVNGSFETGDFTNWETIGNTSIQTSSFGSGPTKGDFQALLFNAQPTAFDLSIELFLGLPFGSLDGLGNGNATTGSAIKQTFTAQAGDTLTFDWNFLTDEATPTVFNDFAFVSIAGVDTLADTSSEFVSSLTPFVEETEFNNFSFTFENTGTYTLGLGVTNSVDTVVNSGLLVDNVNLASVPEPASILGVLAALITGSLFKYKQK